MQITVFKWVLGASASALFLVGACGGDDTGSSVPGPSGDAGLDAVVAPCSSSPAQIDACTQLATNYCDQLFGCDQDLAVLGQWDQGLCKEVQQSQCLRLTGDFAIPAEMTASAATKIQAMSCGDFLNDIGEFVPFAGIAGDGEACNFKTLCLGDNKVCSTQVQGESGVCQTPQSEPCKLVDKVYTCPTGLICNVPTTTCVVVPTSSKRAKDPGAACAPGDNCAGTFVCMGGSCVRGEPAEKHPNLGGPCGGAQNGICGLGLVCIGGDDGDVTGLCEAAGELNQPCPTGLNPKISNPLCVGGLACIEGTCSLPGCK